MLAVFQVPCCWSGGGLAGLIAGQDRGTPVSMKENQPA